MLNSILLRWLGVVVSFMLPILLFAQNENTCYEVTGYFKDVRHQLAVTGKFYFYDTLHIYLVDECGDKFHFTGKLHKKGFFDYSPPSPHAYSNYQRSEGGNRDRTSYFDPDKYFYDLDEKKGLEKIEYYDFKTQAIENARGWSVGNYMEIFGQVRFKDPGRFGTENVVLDGNFLVKKELGELPYIAKECAFRLVENTGEKRTFLGSSLYLHLEFPRACDEEDSPFKPVDTSMTDRKVPEQLEGWPRQGSGIVIDKSGYIATNYHVISDAKEIEADFGLGIVGKSYKCVLVASDIDKDLAILKIVDKSFRPFDSLYYNFSETVVAKGTNVLALGYPKAVDFGTDLKITKGNVGSIGTPEGNYYLDLAVQRGNSGGPLFDERANLTGIIVAKIISGDVDGVSYAIKTIHLKKLIHTNKLTIHLPHSHAFEKADLSSQISILEKYVPLIKVK